MKRRIGIFMAVGVLALGAVVWASGQDFNGNWAIAGSNSGASMTIHQHGDSFRVVMTNADGRHFGASFVANGQTQQLRTHGSMQRTVQASWQGDSLHVESRVLANSKVRRQVSLEISMGNDGNLHVVATRGVGQRARTKNLVLLRQ